MNILFLYLLFQTSTSTTLNFLQKNKLKLGSKTNSFYKLLLEEYTKSNLSDLSDYLYKGNRSQRKHIINNLVKLLYSFIQKYLFSLTQIFVKDVNLNCSVSKIFCLFREKRLNTNSKTSIIWLKLGEEYFNYNVIDFQNSKFEFVIKEITKSSEIKTHRYLRQIKKEIENLIQINYHSNLKLGNTRLQFKKLIWYILNTIFKSCTYKDLNKFVPEIYILEKTARSTIIILIHRNIHYFLLLFMLRYKYLTSLLNINSVNLFNQKYLPKYLVKMFLELKLKIQIQLYYFISQSKYKNLIEVQNVVKLLAGVTFCRLKNDISCFQNFDEKNVCLNLENYIVLCEAILKKINI
ncbi:hypothetical protein TUBRATIS_009740 [Tubulinosema ratisbonensis]|uniref:Uncharacterized protein n=1 Tax=Tubulinosema ratisbonensis TaxID=291195 RepID=A0A437AMW6_9MICR|nr:hypothetical protein TUBRATIS_009740 [Tubulinosema ratisbonensis]